MNSQKAFQDKKIQFFQSNEKAKFIQEYFSKRIKQEREVKPLLKPWGW